MENGFNPKLFQKACLLAAYWWVDCEDEYHRQFRSIDIKRLPYDAFYAFTIKYSVRRTFSVKDAPGQQASNSLLKDLSREFISSCVAGNKDAVDSYGEFHGHNIRSLLSKFATLINPNVFTMYDGNSRVGLNRENSRGDHAVPARYSSFLKEFFVFKKKMNNSIKENDIKYYLSLLYDKQSVDPGSLTYDIFINRVADKYLWYLGSSENV